MSRALLALRVRLMATPLIVAATPSSLAALPTKFEVEWLTSENE